MAKSLPFTFTPSIVRYIRQILEEYESRRQGSIKGQAVLPFSIGLRGYGAGESFMSHTEQMRENFLDYVGEAASIEIQFMGEERLYEDRVSTMITTLGAEWEDGTFGTPVESFGVSVKKIDPFLSLWETYTLQKKNILPVPHGEVIFSRIQFDDKARVLIFGSKVKKFQKANDKTSPRFKLFKTLWEHRRHTLRGEELEGCSGRPLSKRALEESIGLPLKDTDFANLEGVLSRAGMPIEIEHSNEEKVLMIVKEK